MRASAREFRVLTVLSAVEKTNYGGRRNVAECFHLDLQQSFESE